MAKGNLILGNASGKLGDVVLYRKGGYQQSRVRVRQIGNPRSEQQVIQRVVTSTIAKAYSILAGICDHSFEGNQGKAKNMGEFMKLNILAQKNRINVAPMGYRGLTHFNAKTEVQALVNSYVMSAGQLQEVPFQSDGGTFKLGASLAANFTYAQLAAAIGAQQGDQVTFVNVIGETDGTITRMEVHRLILDPDNGDMSTVFLDGTAISRPNPKNEMQGVSLRLMDGALGFDFGYSTSVGNTVIASRYENGVWRRSPSRLYTNTDTTSHTLGTAIDSWAAPVNSSLYLNQAEA